MKNVEVGMGVLFFDAVGKQHNALVTAVWGESTITEDNEGKEVEFHPSLNLVIVSTDPNMSDSYGRQIARTSSVVHGGCQQANGMFWDFK